MPANRSLTSYLAGYPPNLIEQVLLRIHDGSLGLVLLKRYPKAHGVRNDQALQDYVLEVKNKYLRSSLPLAQISYDNHIHVIHNALGTHASRFRVQGSRLKAKREIRIASIISRYAGGVLEMIVTHELALHVKVRDHDKAFYQLCCHIEPAYNQYEFDFRAYLCFLDESTQQNVTVEKHCGTTPLPFPGNRY